MQFWLTICKLITYTNTSKTGADFISQGVGEGVDRWTEWVGESARCGVDYLHYSIFSGKTKITNQGGEITIIVGLWSRASEKTFKMEGPGH